MRSATQIRSSSSRRTAIVLALMALASACPALIGCEAGDGTSPVPPPDAAPDHAIPGDAGGDAKTSDGGATDAQSDADAKGEAGTDGATSGEAATD